MSIAIKRPNGDLIWFDAVTSYAPTYTNTVTSHPVEDGSNISDHTTENNITFSIEAVFSDSDFNLQRPTIDPTAQQTYGISSKQFINNTPVTTQSSTGEVADMGKYQNVVIKGGALSWKDMLPEALRDVLSFDKPDVTINATYKVKTAEMMRDILVDIRNKREKIEIFEFLENDILRSFDTCIITSLTFPHSPDNGDAVYVSMSLEKVRYVPRVNVNVARKNVTKKTSAKTSKPVQQGNCPTDKKKASTEDAKAGATKNSQLDNRPFNKRTGERVPAPLLNSNS